jgi:hopanoid-associated phosphorylase
LLERPASVVFVVGMAREAAILGPHSRVLIGADGLAEALFDAEVVISFGLCGALVPRLAPGALVVADRVIDGAEVFDADALWCERMLQTLPARRGAMAGCDQIVGSRAAKAALAASSGAIAVDMESHKVARAAFAAGIPFVAVRAVSDGANESLPLAAQAGFGADGRADVAAVLGGLVRRPWELGALVRTAFNAQAGLASLTAAARAMSIAALAPRPTAPVRASDYDLAEPA